MAEIVDSGYGSNRTQSQCSSSKSGGSVDTKSIQLAELTTALGVKRKLQNGSGCGGWEEYFEGDEEGGVTLVVSMTNAIIIHQRKGFLGYPKEMLIGRSFMDFIHPKDKMAFNNNKNQNDIPLRLRQYRGLKSTGFGITDKSVVYVPFKLEFELQNGVFLISAERILSAYSEPNEVIKNGAKFMTRHTANCNFGHMDSESISYLGHLPQDLIGSCVLDYYHPEDMELIRGIYGEVLHHQGKKPFRSKKPYRFRVYNGSFALLETDWSCFINPWSWKLEFVIGQHRVLKGPANPDVFMECEEEFKNNMEEIKELLGGRVNKTSGCGGVRRKELVLLLENLLEQMESSNNNSGSNERDSMLGGVSPHSSTTPPSYNQLNYRENIERFFESQTVVGAVKGEVGDSEGEEREGEELMMMQEQQGGVIRSKLTQEHLTRHNEDMEKFMVQRHKTIKNNTRKKRGGVFSEEDYIANKQPHLEKEGEEELWPPFSIGGVAMGRSTFTDAKQVLPVGVVYFKDHTYTLPQKDLTQVLQKDLETLSIIKQPPTLNDQLNLFYFDNDEELYSSEDNPTFHAITHEENSFPLIN